MLLAIPVFVIPLIVLGILIFLLAIVVVLGRIQDGRFLRPVFATLAKVPLFRRWLTKASTVALERSNPELASAVRKLEQSGATRDPQKAQAALSRLTPAERREWLAAAEQQGALPEPANREQRRRMERMQKQTRRRGR